MLLFIISLFVQSAFASPPVIWNGANALFLNSGSIQVPGLSTAGVCYANATGLFSQVPNGTAAQVLTMSGGVPIWQNAASGFADPMTTIGDLILRNASNVTTRLPIGSSGQVLTVTGGVPAWAAAGGGFTNPMTTVGDMIFNNASAIAARLPIGSSGQILSVQSGVPSWLSFAATAPLIYNSSTGALSIPVATTSANGYLSSTDWTTFNNKIGNPTTATGDIIYRNSGGALARLGIGATNQILTVTGGIPAWATNSSFSDPMTSVGDMIIRNNSNVTTRLGIGTTGQVLTVNSSGFPGWAAAGGGGGGSYPLNAVIFGTGTAAAGNVNTFFWDSSNNKLAINLAGSSPTASLHLKPSNASTVGVIVQGQASQTSSLQEFWDSGSIIRALIDSVGNGFFPHLGAKSSAVPTIAGGAGAGSGPSTAVSGGDLAGTITITTGTAPTASSVIATVTFNVAYGSAPRVVFSAANASAATAIMSVYATSTTTTLVLNAATAGLASLTQYIWNYHVIQ